MTETDIIKKQADCNGHELEKREVIGLKAVEWGCYTGPESEVGEWCPERAHR